MNRRYLFALVVTCVVPAACATMLPQARPGDVPETVMVTLRPKAGAESEMAQVVSRHWETARRLDLVLPKSRVSMRAVDEAGKPYFVEVFAWRDARIPDAAPKAILDIWSDMHRLSEARGGRPGVDVVEMIETNTAAK